MSRIEPRGGVGRLVVGLAVMAVVVAACTGSGTAGSSTSAARQPGPATSGTAASGTTAESSPSTSLGAPSSTLPPTIPPIPPTIPPAPPATPPPPVWSSTTLPPADPVPRQDIGPFAGLRWPAGSVRPGDFLYDDGERLVATDLDGNERVIWEHPPVRVFDLAASPGGGEVAISLALSPGVAIDPSAALYLLDDDGSVVLVDVARDFHTLESPLFLRAPTDPNGPVRLYWLDFGDTVVPGTGRLDTRVRTRDNEGPRTVEVPLRYAEAVFGFDGYPGAPWFSLTLFRINDNPTRLEILVNWDVYQSVAASLVLWGEHESRANTDIFVGTAWLDPYRYVIPVAKEEYLDEDYSLRLFVLGCERYGSHLIYEGTEIDRGYSEAPWPLLPSGDGGLLVLGAADTQAYLDAYVQDRLIPIPWQRLDIDTGRLSPTGIAWDQQVWTWVAPEMEAKPLLAEPDCSTYSWTYP